MYMHKPLHQDTAYFLTPPLLRTLHVVPMVFAIIERDSTLQKTYHQLTLIMLHSPVCRQTQREPRLSSSPRGARGSLSSAQFGEELIRPAAPWVSPPLATRSHSHRHLPPSSSHL